MEFLRKPLRDDIQKEILKRIVDGTLPSGQRINETHLAQDLGLSRTPLREAMLGLTASGQLVSHMGRGFAVPAMSLTQWNQIQGMLLLLQPAALIQSAPIGREVVLALSNHLNRTRMALSRSPQGKAAGQALVALVFNWNESLLAECPSPLLAQDVSRLESLAARYWFAAGFQGAGYEGLLDSFLGIYELLRTGNIERASQVWASHIEKYSGEIGSVLEDKLQDKAQT